MLIMKLNKLFHWLYFCVMALPLVVAPIFAIYSHRHTLTEQTTVDIQYKYQSNEVNNFDDLIEGNVYNLDLNNANYDLIDFSFVLVSGEIYCESISYIEMDEYYVGYRTPYNLYKEDVFGSLSFLRYDDLSILGYFDFDYISSYNAVIQLLHINEFGSFTDVASLFSYTDYNEVESVTVNDSSSDIMSVFVNNYAEVINKYFNYDNAFNFGGLYTWLNTNFFSGNAPLGFFIFWHLLIYWLLTSLLWLIFDVLMYVPMLVHRWLDKASLS